MDFFFIYWREILASISVLIALYSYQKYIRSIFAWETEPHIFSWWVWTLTTGIAFFAQMAGWWGWGSAQGGITAFVCLFVTFLAIKHWSMKIDRMDFLSLGLAFIAIIFWRITENPFYASFFAMLADAIGYIPTFRKVWEKPESEPAGYYLLMNLKHGLSLMSLSVYSWTTMIFSGSVLVINFLIIFIQKIRKK